MKKLKGRKVVVPQSREEAFRLAFLDAMIGDRISMDQLEFCDEITSKLVSKIPYMFFSEGRAVVYNNEIHILGDKEGGGRLVFYHYKWDGSNWIKLSIMPYPFMLGNTVVFNDEIHILGSYYNQYIHYKLLSEPLKLYTIKESN